MTPSAKIIDTLRQDHPEAPSPFSRDDALGTTDGVRLLAPYLASVSVNKAMGTAGDQHKHVHLLHCGRAA